MNGRTILIDNTWREANDGQTIPVVNPSTGETFGTLSRGGAAEIDEAVRAARTAFDDTWSKVSPVDRGRMLTRLGQLILDHHEGLSLRECRDVGKPLTQARKDITACARYCEFYGGAADKLHGETLPYEPGYLVLALREPFGVKAGLPPGVLNLVTGYGKESGAALAGHPGIDHISFTGSPYTGTLVQQAAAVHNRPATMELGGKSPQIVFADADLDLALPSLYGALIQNAGQTCSAGSRILIEGSRFDEVVDALSKRFASTTVGPAESDPDCGPVISAKQAERVQGFLNRAEEASLTVTAQAGPGAAGAGGFYVTPRLYAPVNADHELSSQEIFGPVLIATPFKDEAEAVRLANATEYGLVSGVWTTNGGRQLRVARALDCGQVFVNTYGAGGGVELPFGGVKRSGYGREKGMDGLLSFTRVKTVALFHG